MISIKEWESMRCIDKTMWLEHNRKVNCRGGPRRKLCGVGVNDAKYCTKPRIEGRQAHDPAYVAWSSILKRVYDTRFHERQPTYSMSSVCADWHSFMKFREWWIANHTEGFAIDKDLLSDSKEYSTETCLFVPSWLNNFTIDNGADRGEFPIGVHLRMDNGLFMARCNNPISGAREFLGHFDTPENAHKAWRARKLEIALELSRRWT